MTVTFVNHLSVFTPRAPKYVDYIPCPMCAVPRIGLEYQGVLMSGVKLHTVGAHSSGRGNVGNGLPRCLGSGLKMEFVAGVWRGVPS
jgi:hypothetical protein